MYLQYFPVGMSFLIPLLSLFPPLFAWIDSLKALSVCLKLSLICQQVGLSCRKHCFVCQGLGGGREKGLFRVTHLENSYFQVPV